MMTNEQSRPVDKGIILYGRTGMSVLLLGRSDILV